MLESCVYFFQSIWATCLRLSTYAHVQGSNGAHDWNSFPQIRKTGTLISNSLLPLTKNPGILHWWPNFSNFSKFWKRKAAKFETPVNSPFDNANTQRFAICSCFQTDFHPCTQHILGTTHVVALALRALVYKEKFRIEVGRLLICRCLHLRTLWTVCNKPIHAH